MNALAVNLRTVQARIAVAAERIGRDPAEITLVVVTKTQSLEAIHVAYDLGLRHFGENRVEEAEDKVPQLPSDVIWHMIGHIQSRKAKKVVPLFQFIHSVDSIELAHRLSNLCADRTEKLPVLLECNVSGEANKYGLAAERWAEDHEARGVLLASIEQVLCLPHLDVQGLMTMAPIVSHPEQARPVFLRLRQLRDELEAAFPLANWHHLSMGMTDDFEVAIDEGATLIRLGRALFAPQHPPWRRV